MEEIKSRYYTVQEIKKMEGCGRDAAYDLANKLAHEKRGTQIFVFAEAYEEYFEKKKEKAYSKKMENNKTNSNVYQIRKFS